MSRGSTITRMMAEFHEKEKGTILNALMKAVMKEGNESSPEAKLFGEIFIEEYDGYKDMSSLQRFDWRRAFELGYKIARVPDEAKADIRTALTNRNEGRTS